ncbi:peptidylprolyl isomerase [Ohtaekwangia koreensis]|uniref:peptidylprolyl isomerase n=1 Tax=Ohtaekwangia koreensis TaxID=688867 RepID=A0A1T5LKR6_9BACT|nr:peptidylprolyl isomerase [Ohtaekwangia koreensis]SKC76068.1 Peptidyl-prolyl cis-trans isomerase (rotamase)-cyclophilin family [Ohtaekwangia koreensis]
MIRIVASGIALSLIMSVLISCTKPKQSINKFSDTVFVKIADFQDRRLSDSLYIYFKNENAAYRKDAVLAFASIQDTTAIDALQEVLLNDTDSLVRQAAAYALGQTKSNRSAVALATALKKEKLSFILKEILEAYGKVTSRWDLTVTPKDSIVTEGLALSYYRAGLKKTIDSTFHKRASELLQKPNTEPTRLAAAHYFARGANGFDRYEKAILHAARYDLSSDVRMASALALGKIKSDSSRVNLEYIVKSDADYRIRVNAIRALQSFPFTKTKVTLLNTLTDEQVNIPVTTSEVIKEVITKDDWKEVASIAKVASNPRVQANLYEAALRVSDDKALAEEIANQVKSASNPYKKSAFLSALQQSVMMYAFVEEQLFAADTPVVKLSAAAALVAMNYHKDFKPSLQKHFSDIYIKALQTGDAAVIGTIAGALMDSTLRYKSIMKDYTFLYDAKKQLSLPKDNEALQTLEAAIAFFEGKKNSPPVQNEFNHPIDWKLVKSIPKNQKVMVRTTKGDIILKLLVEEAPGSVANFVALLNQKYFDQKFFHRVVPNFVVQAGCNRGDGWGSEDYSIRSEFSLIRYKTGSVGMASAGKDTEGTQWFITHSPTPHLDGRYTIFADVESGMEIVHLIEVGDQILEVSFVQ